MRVLLAAAELRPLVTVGGLGEAVAGLVGSLRRAGHAVEVVVPDYRRWPLAAVEARRLPVPAWAGPATARRGTHPEAGPVTVIDVPGIDRPHPYVDDRGEGWADNDLRFAAFSAAVAALADVGDYDIVHLNDWHTSLVPAFLASPVATVLTVHNLAHQGWADIGWLHRLPARRNDYARGDALNALAGGLKAADRIIAVSPTYAAEIATVEGGHGLHDVVAARSEHITGIRNGIDAASWDPNTDPLLPANYESG